MRKERTKVVPFRLLGGTHATRLDKKGRCGGCFVPRCGVQTNSVAKAGMEEVTRGGAVGRWSKMLHLRGNVTVDTVRSAAAPCVAAASVSR